jgi:hypothetical protein
VGILGSRQDTQPPTAAAAGRWEYRSEVNKGDLSARWLPRHLNDMASQGWRLHTAFEQHGNTVFIWERER